MMPARIITASSYNPNLPLTPAPGFADSFNRPDGPLGTATSGDVWTTWPVSTATTVGQIVSGAATNTAGTGVAYPVLDAALGNGIYTATVKTVGDRAGGIMIRGIDASNVIQLALRVSAGDAHYRLQRVTAGVSSTLATAATAVSTDGDVIQITINGESISVKINGTVALAATSAQGLTATRHGLYMLGTSTGITWDDISFTALP